MLDISMEGHNFLFSWLFIYCASIRSFSSLHCARINEEEVFQLLPLTKFMQLRYEVRYYLFEYHVF